MAQTWTELLDDIKVRGMIPTSQNTFTEARLLRLAKAELRARVVPLIDEVREGFYQYDIDTALNATGIYDIHTRAVGAKLVNAALVTDQDRLDLTLYNEEQLVNYDSPPGDYGFFFRRSQVQLVPRVPIGWTYFRQTIILAPATIVAQSSAAQITAINTTSGLVTFTNVPSAWTTANTFDMVQQKAHFDTLAIDLVGSAVVTGDLGTITFTPAALPSRLAVGDWVSLSGETPVIQVPEEFLPILAQFTANQCLKAQTDLEAQKAGVEDAKQLVEGVVKLISPRIEQEGRKIVNSTGILRRGF